MMKIRKYWEANFLTTELVLAVVLAVLFYIWSEFINNGIFLSRFFADNRESIYTQ